MDLTSGLSDSDNAIVERTKFVEDLATVNSAVKELSIQGNTQNIRRLHDLDRLERLNVYKVRQNELNEILKYVKVSSLKVYGVQAHDLSGFESLDSLISLDINWNTKAEKLWDISKNHNLKSLSILDFSKLHDLSQLNGVTSINQLTLGGGIWNKLTLNSLQPISTMCNLQVLDLSNFRIVADAEILQPIGMLTQLRELKLSNQFPTEEYARLSVKLPNTKCEKFKAYQILSNGFDDKDVMVTGSRKPFLNLEKDIDKLQKYEIMFKKLQEKWR